MPDSFQDRLNRAADRAFVGRDEELAMFRRLLTAAEPEALVLVVHGPGGIGKTSLLRAFARECTATGAVPVSLDARAFGASREEFTAALTRSIGDAGSDPLGAVAATSVLHVLMIDTFELMEDAEDWFVQDFLPTLPANLVVVLGGRNPPGPAWRREPGWQRLMRAVPLRNLRMADAERLLLDAGVPDHLTPRLLRPTHGHPLAVSLVLELHQLHGDEVIDPTESPDIVRALVERLVMKVPSPSHRLALEATALARYINEDLLAAMLDAPDASSLFGWLRSLNFMESGPFGLYPHDVAREALARDLRWRNPSQYHELHRRARKYFIAKAHATPDQAEQRRYLRDFVFLHRENPVIAPLYERLRTETGPAADFSDSFAPETDSEAIIAMVAAHEGAESAAWARQWMQAHPEAVTVFRGESGQVDGVLITLDLAASDTTLIERDPGMRASRNHLDAKAPLRPGERASVFRFWMSASDYHGLSHVQMSIFVHMVQHYLMTPGLAHTYMPSGVTDEIEPVLAYGDIYRIPEADFELGGRAFGMFGHDWRVRPPDAWLELMGQRQVGAVPSRQAPESSPSLTVLSRDDFGEAVRDALRVLARPDRMRGNPLLQSALVRDRADGDDQAALVEALRITVTQAVESLEAAPRLDKAFRALDRTYLRPAPSQEVAAELLDIPYSTFRRHLTRGVNEVVETLWRLEIAAE